MSIISTILGVESSGGHNVTQGNIGDINNRTGNLAQGYFQITNPTWVQFGGSSTGFSSAIAAPYATQLQIAQNIPVARWGSNTQTALNAAGYYPQPGETLGQMLTRYGEDPAATVPADGSSAGAIVTSTGPMDGGSGSAFDALNPTIVNDQPGSSAIGSGTGPAGPGGIGSDTVASGGIAPVDANVTTGQIPGVTEGSGGGQINTTAPQAQNQSPIPGQPIYISDPSQIGTAGANAIASATTKAGQDVQQSAGVLTAAGTSWLGDIFTGAQNGLIRGAFIALGLVILIGAFAFFYMEGRPLPSLVKA